MSEPTPPTMASNGSLAAGSTPAGKIGSWIKEKYRLDSILGDGGMAVVYAATHRNKKRFAVKMLRVELSNVEDIRTRFLREGYVANTVDHPGVVAVIDDDVGDDGCAFLVMELLEGASLEDLALRTTDGKLPTATVLAAMHQVLDVLAAAHAKNVIHRDLKPANLFVTKTGQAKVLDFGIARLREANLTNATQTGHMMGTPAFMAPEQARGKASLIGPQTDLYAIGATMFSLLSGLDVHHGETAQEVMFEAGSKPAPSLLTVWRQAHPALVNLVDRALAFDPKDRWQDAGAMRDATATVFADMMGEPISPKALAGVLRVRIAASNPDLDAKGYEEAARTMAAPLELRKKDNPLQTLALASAPPTPVGHTTEQPVSSSARPSVTVRTAKSRAPMYVGAAAVIAVVGLGLVALESSNAKTAAALPPRPAVADTTAAPSTSVVSDTPATATAPATGPAATALGSAEASASATSSARPPTSASARSRSSTPSTKPPSHSHSSDFDRR